MRHYHGYTPYLLVMTIIFPAIVLIQKHTVRPVQLYEQLDAFPLAISHWSTIKNFTLTNDVIAMLQPSDYLSRRYTDKNNVIADLYVAYYDGGYNRVGIHSPLYCMPGNGWRETYRNTSTKVINNYSVNYCELVFEKDGMSEFMVYWYQVGSHTTSSQYMLKAFTAFNSVFLKRRDQSLIRVTVNAQNGIDEARKIAWQFVMDIQPAISLLIPN